MRRAALSLSPPVQAAHYAHYLRADPELASMAAAQDGPELSLTLAIDLYARGMLPAEEAVPLLKKRLGDEDPWIRYWALTAAISLGDAGRSLAGLARVRLLDEPERLVRVRAAEIVLNRLCEALG